MNHPFEEFARPRLKDPFLMFEEPNLEIQNLFESIHLITKQ